MRRVAIRALRTARRTNVRRALSRKGSPFSSQSFVLGIQTGTTSQRLQSPSTILQSSMYLRNFTISLFSAAVLSGAWFAYRGNPVSESGVSKSNASLGGVGNYPEAFSTSSAFSNPQQTTLSNSPTTEEAAASTRRALVVEDDQFYAGDIQGDQPLTKETEASGRIVVEMLTPEQVTQKLRQNEGSYAVGRGRGVIRYDVTQMASNNPIEDDHAEKIVEVPQAVAATQDGAAASDWMFWGVFDGHSGWTTSAKLRQALISFVVRELNMVYKSALTDTTLTYPTPESIDAAIKHAFNRLDNEIVHESVEKVKKAGSKRAAAELLAPALSGSCALLSFYDSRSKLLRVACTGDSRAVLGRRGSNGKWTATALSEDLTGGTPSEIARLRAEHPGEDMVTSNGRILGQLEPSRAFGDAVYKWSRETSKMLRTTFFGKSPSPHLKTPPYVTAEPVVTTTQVNPEKGDFVVMATDGLWECLTNEEVIGLVGQWLDSQNNGAKKSWFSHTDGSLPVEKVDVRKGDGQRAPIRQDQWQVDGGDERFVVEDKNVATHLVRNALGGKNTDMLCALLTLPSPYARRYRDDLTVEVIFFGEGDRSGKVVPIPEASASKLDIKSKL